MRPHQAEACSWSGKRLLLTFRHERKDSHSFLKQEKAECSFFLSERLNIVLIAEALSSFFRCFPFQQKTFLSENTVGAIAVF
jgi:hypothetical protein